MGLHIVKGVAGVVEKIINFDRNLNEIFIAEGVTYFSHV